MKKPTRRRLLALLGASPALSPLSGDISVATSASSPAGSENRPPSSSVTDIEEWIQFDPPTTNPHDATIFINAGLSLIREFSDWEEATDSELAQFLHFFHGDVYCGDRLVGPRGPPSFAGLPQDTTTQGRVGLREGFPMSTQVQFWGQVRDETQPWLQKAAEEGYWDDTDFVSDPKQLYSENYNGESLKPPSVFADPYVEILSEPVIEMFELGYSYLHIDGSTDSRLAGTDFSKYAQNAFRNYLSELPPEELDRLGINSVDQFNIREYIEENEIAPATGNNPFEDPVFREYVLFDHHGIKEYFEQFAKRVRSHFSDTDSSRVNLRSNNYLGDKLDQTPVSSYYTTLSEDVVEIEDELSIPPDFLRDVIYKIGLSIGKYDKVATSNGSLKSTRSIVQELDLDTSVYRPTLLRIRFGEGYATGGRPQIYPEGGGTEVDEIANNWVRQDLSMDESLQSIVDFVWAFSPYLINTTPDHRVALVNSLPTHLWSTEPLWFNGPEYPRPGRRGYHPDSFRGAAETLTRRQIPYDVITFGYPGLWTDPEQLDMLSKYELVILPNIESISDEQLSAIEEALDSGTSFVVTGELPDRTEEFEPRGDVASLLTDEPEVKILEGDPVMADHSFPAVPNRDADQFIETVDTLHDRQIEIEATNVGVHVQSQPSLSRTFVHIVNHDYDQSTDEVSHKTEFSLAIRDLDFNPEVVRWYNDTGSMALEFSVDNDRVQTTIPKVQEWGFLLLSDSEDAVIESGDQNVAESSIETAQQLVNEARNDDRTAGLVEAEAELHRAEVAADYGRYELAVQKAEEAAKSAELSSERPNIGIDGAHGQTDDQGYVLEEYYNDVSENYEEYNVSIIENWSESIFNTIDTLVIPPVQNRQYGFSDEEITLVDEFVASGGNLVIPGKVGLGEDINDITSIFGFTFDRAELGWEEMENEDEIFGPEMRDKITVSVERSELTLMVPNLSNPDTVLDVVGDGTVFARIPEDSDAWINREGHINERNPADEPAAGKPVGLIASHGQGLVVGLGMFGFIRNGRALGQNILTTTGRYSQRNSMNEKSTVEKEEEPIAEEEESVAEEDDEDSNQRETETASDAGPGFGKVSGLVGLGGIAYILKRKITDEKE